MCGGGPLRSPMASLFSLKSPVYQICILQEIRNWRRGRLGNNTTLISLLFVRYDPHTNRWTPVASMHSKRKHLGVTVLDNMIYAVGGRDEHSELNSVEKYVYKE